MRECCRQSQAEVVSNSRNKIHQTWGPPFSRALYFPARVGSGRMRVGVRAGREGGYRVTSGPEGRKEAFCVQIPCRPSLPRRASRRGRANGCGTNFHFILLRQRRERERQRVCVLTPLHLLSYSPSVHRESCGLHSTWI